MSEATSSTNNFLIKIDKIKKNSYSAALFLKADDVIVALNNQFYTYGEKRLIEELKDLRKSGEKAILTILRKDIVFDIIVENSLGCNFVTTDGEETEESKTFLQRKTTT